jgi:hypothetical protein
MKVKRFPANPIIRPNMSPRMGGNVNGSSLIRVPDWIENPLGCYYLYFGHHCGTYIRLAYADDLHGRCHLYEPGVLPLAASGFAYNRFARRPCGQRAPATPTLLSRSGPTLGPAAAASLDQGSLDQRRQDYPQPSRALDRRPRLPGALRPYMRIFRWGGWHCALTSQILVSAAGPSRSWPLGHAVAAQPDVLKAINRISATYYITSRLNLRRASRLSLRRRRR